jgi:hypothetical protein
VPPLPAPGGSVTPWLFKHCWNAVRVALDPVGDVPDADVEVVLVLLLPHAASARLAVIAASAGIIRNAGRRVLVGNFMWGPFVVVFGQPALLIACAEAADDLRPAGTPQAATRAPPFDSS